MTLEGQDEGNKRISKNDKISIFILLVLYVIQATPVGLGLSIRLMLQDKNISYKDQAMFSLIGWPYSLKLFWAPIVDSLYWKYVGRRKTWVISTQYILGIFMLILSFSVQSFFGDSSVKPNVIALTAAFFCLHFLCATQDIAVDGWALTMLSRQNVGFASVCNSVGFRTGIFFGNVIFLVLESPDFCNRYLRSDPQPEGFITLAGFLKVSGLFYLIATTVILVFISEPEENCSQTFNIKDTYKQVYHIMCIKHVFILFVFLLTYQIALAATDSVGKLKLMEAGVRKENMALLEIPIIPIEILFPIYMSRYTTGINPLNVFLKAYPYRLMLGVFSAVLLWWTYNVKLESGYFPTHYYMIIVMFFVMHQILAICIHLSIGSFFNRVSDPVIGGTYMTLLNTFSNLGRNWTHTLALWLVDILTLKECENPIYSCDKNEKALSCSMAGYNCSTYFDGYYIETIASVIFGFFWLRWSWRIAVRLQSTLLSEWKIQYSQLPNLESSSSTS